MKSSAYSPSHITGLFRICNGTTDPLGIGSIGAGVSLANGIKTDVDVVKFGKTDSKIKLKSPFSFTGIPIVSELVISKFRQISRDSFFVDVTHEIDVPIGSGFGASGASALSLAISLNEALGTDLSEVEVAQLAHVVEIECKTGLGTVLAEAEGGIEMRVKPGAPGIGKIEKIETPEDAMVVAVTVGDMYTRNALEDLKTRASVNRLSEQYLNQVFREKSLDSLLRASRDFGRSLGFLTDEMNKLVDIADSGGYVCGVAFFGKTVFSIVRENEVQELSRLLLKALGSGQLLSCEVSSRGARLIGSEN